MNLELLPSDNGSALNAAVRLEAGNWQQVGSAYADAAVHVAALFAAGDHDAIHLYMCDAQDRTTDPAVWNRTLQAFARAPRSALKSLPDPLQLVSVRDFRPTHRKQNALFKVELVATVKADRQAAEQVAAEQAAAIEQRAAEQRVEEQRAADAAISPADVAAATWAEIMRLGWTTEQAADVISELLGTLAFGHMQIYCALIDERAADLASLRAAERAAERPAERAAA